MKVFLDEVADVALIVAVILVLWAIAGHYAGWGPHWERFIDVFTALCAFSAISGILAADTESADDPGAVPKHDQQPAGLPREARDEPQVDGELIVDEADSLPVKAGADGSVEMIIGHEHGKVVQRFQRPMLYVLYEPVNAVGVAKTMIDTAVVLGADVQIQLPKLKITERKRQALITRATHVLRSMQEQGRAPAYIANHVVDSILSAID